MSKKNLDLITMHVEKEAAWNRGSDYPWEGWAMLDAAFLASLVTLAAHAPRAEIDAFLEQESVF